MKRLVEHNIKAFKNKKIILISGPRQCGKTTLSKMLDDDFDYINYDVVEDRIILQEKSWDRDKPLIIFDEIHKMRQWKTFIKGVYDKEGIPPAIVVTGSAKLETYRKVGDSMAGRYLRFRLHPLDLFELNKFDKNFNKKNSFLRLLNQGGFPEPYFEQSPNFHNLWRKTHVDAMLREDLIGITEVKHIRLIETLIERLRSMVASPVSYTSLARDLEVSPNTVKNWLNLLEELYIIFKITPYSKNISRSLLKSPKYYFFDNGQVKGDNGQKFENLVACALLKRCHYLEDTEGKSLHLHYIRDKEKHEVDFAISDDGLVTHLIEAKWKESNLSKSLAYFFPDNSNLKRIQLVAELTRQKTFENKIKITPAIDWLLNMPL